MEAKDYKVGTKVEIVHLRHPEKYPSDFIGKQGIITEIKDVSWNHFNIRIEIQGVELRQSYDWYAEDEFKVIPETPQLAVGTKVLWDDKSYALEMDNGTLQFVASKGFHDYDKEIYEITTVSQQLPGANDFLGTPQTNDTIIRRISDSKVYFVRQEFLKEYVALPKFKRGDYIEYCSEYFRIAKVNDDGTYVITSSPSGYDDGSASIVAKESELSEVTQ